jgi:hypothetical protein
MKSRLQTRQSLRIPVGKAAGLSKYEIQAKIIILSGWLNAKAFVEFMGLKVNSSDFKNYVISGLACHKEMEGLRTELTEIIRKLLEQQE